MMNRTARLGAIAVLALAGMAVSAAAPLAIAAPPPATTAAPQVKTPQINAQQLAVVERALEFCSPIDADSAKKLKEHVAALTKGASADALTQARSSEVYKAAYSAMDGFIGQIDPRNAKVACANTARGK